MPSKANITDAPVKYQSQIAALYGRVSTARQEDEETIDVQVADIKERIATDGNVLPPENIFLDDGWTGSILKRPALDDMRKAALEGKFQVLFVYDRGRLARLYHLQRVITDDLEDLGIRVVSLHGKEAESDMDKVFQAMEGVFHEYERAKITERFRIAKMQRAKAGRLINGHALYGYKIIRHPDESKEYVIFEEEARVVRLMFQWFVKEGVSLRQIIKRLLDLGIPPRKRKSESWTKGPLERILTCDSYVKGAVYFNKYEAIVPKHPTNKDEYRRVKKSSRRTRPKEEWIPYPVPPLIPDDGTFEKTQEMLEQNKRYHAKHRKRSYLLSGKTFCGCGFRRVGDPGGNGNTYYRCAQHIYNYPKPTECTFPGINSQALDAAVWSALTHIMEKPELLREQAEIHIKERAVGAGVEKEKYRLQQVIDRVREEYERYARAYGSGDLEFEEYRRLTRDAKRRIKAYQQQLDALVTETEQQADGDDVGALCKLAAQVLKNMGVENKRLLIRHAVKKVVVYREEVEVVIHIPLPSTACTVKVAYEPKSRHRRPPKRGEIHVIQCVDQTTSRGEEFSVYHY